MRYTPAMMAYSLARALAAYQAQCDIMRVLGAIESATTAELHAAMVQRSGMTRTALERHLTKLRAAHAVVAHPMRGDTDRQGVVWTLPGRQPAGRAKKPSTRFVRRRELEQEGVSWWVSRPRDGFTQAARTRRH